MEKKILTRSEIKDFIQKHLGFNRIEEEDDLRSDLRLGEMRITELVAVCNVQFKASVKKEKLRKVKNLINKVKETAEVEETVE